MDTIVLRVVISRTADGGYRANCLELGAGLVGRTFAELEKRLTAAAIALVGEGTSGVAEPPPQVVIRQRFPKADEPNQ